MARKMSQQTTAGARTSTQKGAELPFWGQGPSWVYMQAGPRARGKVILSPANYCYAHPAARNNLDYTAALNCESSWNHPVAATRCRVPVIGCTWWGMLTESKRTSVPAAGDISWK